jgi:thiol-disulfide isomerase/thioredoxin
MRRPRAIVAALAAIAIAIAGCSPTGGGTPSSGNGTPPSSAVPSSGTSPSPAPTEPSASGAEPSANYAEPSASGAEPSSGGGVVLTQPWATATLTDVTTGTSFRIADLADDGRTVFVEAMAIWCTKCRAQQGEFTSALARLDQESVAYVVLTVDPSETAEALAAYRADRGFSGTYAVAGREVSAALEVDFGPTVLSPPTVPVIVISPDGSVEHRTGHHSADEIVAAVQG